MVAITCQARLAVENVFFFYNEIDLVGGAFTTNKYYELHTGDHFVNFNTDSRCVGAGIVLGSPNVAFYAITLWKVGTTRIEIVELDHTSNSLKTYSISGNNFSKFHVEQTAAHFDESVGTANAFRFATNLEKDSTTYARKQFAFFGLTSGSQCSPVGAS